MPAEKKRTPAAENPHLGHRDRVRDRFLTGGLEAFPDVNVLEFLLFHAYQQGDTNEIAHRLYDHFGKSLIHVLEAPYEDLRKVKGIGKNSAVLIMLAAQLAKRYYNDSTKIKKLSFDSSEAFRAYVLAQFMNAQQEIAFLICLDNAAQLQQCIPVSLGTKYSVSLDNRTLLETAFRYGATKVALAHNHPNGLAAPSRNDVIRTESAIRLFQSVSIQLLDHLIVAQGECFSMANSIKFGHLFLQNDARLDMCADIK